MATITGRIFDIQRFSLHDGEGIRTTVFFKGCSLRCLWCHNPESQNPFPELAFYPFKCNGCGKCKDFCPHAFTQECARCGGCVAICPNSARELFGKTMTAEEVFNVVKRDVNYYRTSGGGVTLSGGEPLLQPEFAAEILSLAKRSDISTAVETAGNVPFSSFETVLPYVDIFLYDIKAMDAEKHRILTGVDNELILDNARRLRSMGVKILFRTPIVPGYNDDEADRIYEFCAADWELLGYHNIAQGKYAALCRPYPTASVVPPTEEYMRALANKYGAIYRPTGI